MGGIKRVSANFIGIKRAGNLVTKKVLNKIILSDYENNKTAMDKDELVALAYHFNLPCLDYMLESIPTPDIS